MRNKIWFPILFLSLVKEHLTLVAFIKTKCYINKSKGNKTILPFQWMPKGESDQIQQLLPSHLGREA